MGRLREVLADKGQLLVAARLHPTPRLLSQALLLPPDGDGHGGARVPGNSRRLREQVFHPSPVGEKLGRALQG